MRCRWPSRVWCGGGSWPQPARRWPAASRAPPLSGRRCWRRAAPEETGCRHRSAPPPYPTGCPRWPPATPTDPPVGADRQARRACRARPDRLDTDSGRRRRSRSSQAAEPRRLRPRERLSTGPGTHLSVNWAEAQRQVLKLSVNWSEAQRQLVRSSAPTVPKLSVDWAVLIAHFSSRFTEQRIVRRETISFHVCGILIVWARGIDAILYCVYGCMCIQVMSTGILSAIIMFSTS